MVTTEEKKVFRILYLVGEEEADCFQRLLPSVHVVAQEEIVSIGRKCAILKESEEVCVLPMDVT